MQWPAEALLGVRHNEIPWLVPRVSHIQSHWQAEEFQVTALLIGYQHPAAAFKVWWGPVVEAPLLQSGSLSRLPG